MAAVHWRLTTYAYQVRQNASEIVKRAETLAEQKNYQDAVTYYTSYLGQFPNDADARLRRAEIFEMMSHGQRAIEQYQYALATPGKGLSSEKKVKAKRRLCELLLEGNLLALAQTEIIGSNKDEPGKIPPNNSEPLAVLEQKELADKPDHWHAPGLKALVLAAKYRVDNMSVSAASLEAAFAEVLPAKNEQAKVFIGPEVYLARYDYRLQKSLQRSKDPNGSAYLAASDEAKGDLEEALKLAPDNIAVLLKAASAAQQRGAAEAATGGGSAAQLAEARDKSNALYSQAIEYYERAIKTAPQDARAYGALGTLFASRGNFQGAINTWERGLDEVQNEGPRMGLNLMLVDAFIQQGRFMDAESKLKSVSELLALLSPQSRLEPQRLVDLRSGKLAFLRGHYNEAINLVTDLASGRLLVQGEETTATPRDRFEAWLLLGRSNAELASAFKNAAAQYSEAAPKEAAAPRWELALKEAAAQHWEVELKQDAPKTWELSLKEAAAGQCDLALKHLGRALQEAAAPCWDRALGAYKKAALLEPREVSPHLGAAEASIAAGESALAVTNYQQALEVVGALKPPPEGLQIVIYDALIGLLNEQKKTTERDLYVGRAQGN